MYSFFCFGTRALDGGAGSARGAHDDVSSGAKRLHMPTPIAAVEGGAPSSPRKRRVTSTSGGDQVLFVCFSSKHLTDDGAGALRSTQFFESHPRLVVVTNSELSRVLPPFLLTRVTTTAQEQG